VFQDTWATEIKDRKVSRLSQYFWYLDAAEHPTALEQKVHYDSLEITREIKELRRKHRKKTRMGDGE